MRFLFYTILVYPFLLIEYAIGPAGPDFLFLFIVFVILYERYIFTLFFALVGGMISDFLRPAFLGSGMFTALIIVFLLTILKRFLYRGHFLFIGLPMGFLLRALILFLMGQLDSPRIFLFRTLSTLVIAPLFIFLMKRIFHGK